MRLFYQRISIICGTLFAFLAAPGCGDDSYRDRDQFRQMEMALDSISVESDPNWKTRLDAAEKIVVDNPEIRKVHRLCITAYREYATAMDEMETARAGLKKLEKTIASGQMGGVATEYASAREAITQTSAHLETSQTLIQRCMQLRRDMKGRLKLTRN